MEKKKIRVEIVAAVYNRRDITLLCLKSIRRLRSDGLDIHTIIVDDGCTDGTGDSIREQYPEVEVVQGDGNLWYTEGTNVGIRAAMKHAPDYVLLINDDQIFDEDAMQRLVKTAEDNPRSVVGGLLLLWDQPHKVFQVSPVWEMWSGGWRHWHRQTVWTVPEKAWKVDIVVGNCMLVPAAAFKEAGLMDSKHYPNYGDVEFTPRLKKLGWNLLVEPRARIFCLPNTVFHVDRSSTKSLYKTLYGDLKDRQNLRRRYYACMVAAPNKLQGLVAFGMFCFRVLIKRNYENDAWLAQFPEAPLRQTFASAVVDDK